MKSSATACFLMLLGTYAASGATPRPPQPVKVAAPTKPISPQQPAMRAGHAIYVDNCSACHATAGTGLTGLFPPLKANPIVQAADAATPIRLILAGSKRAATNHVPTGTAMPAFGWKLSDAEIAAVATYIRNSWGNGAPAVSAEAVRGARRNYCSKLGPRLHLNRRSDRICGSSAY